VTSLRRDELLHAISDTLRPVLPFDEAAINIYEPETDLLRIFALKIEDKTRLLAGSTLNRKDSASGWVLDNQKTLRRHDLEKEAQFEVERLMIDEGIRSLCIVPLTFQGRCLGTLTMLSKSIGQYSEADADFLRDVANQIALAIENMKSYEEIAALNARAQLVLDTAAEGIYDCEPDGTCVFCNQAGAHLLGYDDTDELLGKNMHTTGHHSRADGSPYPLEEWPIYVGFQKNQGVHRDDEVFWKKDGSSCPVEYWSHPMVQHGRTVGAVVTFVDITERRKLEEQFHRAQRLESVGRLAGGVAHDFNNLLTVINGYAEMLMKDLPQESDILASVAEIRGAGDCAAALTQQLLAFSRKQLIQPAALNLNEIVADLEKMLRRLIGDDIELVTKVAADLGNVKADSGQLQQIIMNLAVNARDAMPCGGSLLLETANVTFDDEYAASHPDVRSGEHVMLTVTDTGIGMSPEVKARLFEPFFTTKPKGIGTGLGLATVYGMVKQSGGWIGVYSEPGRGATFKVYLPRTDEAVAQPKTVVKTDGRGHETILVVEDQPKVRALAANALRRFGYTVLSASRGDEALAIARHFNGTIHLLLTDVVMPGMNGRDLARQIAEQRPDLRILFMSGYTESALADDVALDCGVAHIDKPFTPDSLAEKVREVLGPRSLRATILIVDDDESVRRLLRHMLTRAGFVIVEAANGRQALAQLGDHTEVSLVLTDLVMSEQEGIEEQEGIKLIRHLLRHRPSLKVIAMSGSFGGEILPVAGSMGVATLRKPISREHLLQSIRQVVKPTTRVKG
jgi:PAS domain S-box-containing protein